MSLYEAHPDRLPDGRLHLPKLNSLYLRLQELVALQGQHPPCSANEDLLHLLTVKLRPVLPKSPQDHRGPIFRALSYGGSGGPG